MLVPTVMNSLINNDAIDEDNLEATKAVLHQQLHAISNMPDLEQVRVELLGKSGIIAQKFKILRELQGEAKQSYGQRLNQLKEMVQDMFAEQQQYVLKLEIARRLQQESLDLTLPHRAFPRGTLHILNETANQVRSILEEMGFLYWDGPDIEVEEYNFDALNIPPLHPARGLHDSFYLQGSEHMLRTHTSPVQIRAMRQLGAPLQVMALGRAYRADYDATHTPMFHQIEGLVVGPKISMAHLRSCLQEFLQRLLQVDNIKMRFRPGFFPFTEPSAEVDIAYIKEGNSLIVDIPDGQPHSWLEVLGSGMVHPQVLRNCGIDPQQYSGFAFGAGLERLTMIKYGINDIRGLFDGDVRWLKHFDLSC